MCTDQGPGLTIMPHGNDLPLQEKRKRHRPVRKDAEVAVEKALRLWYSNKYQSRVRPLVTRNRTS